MFNNNLLMGAASAGESLVEVGNSALYTTSSQELERTPGSAGNVDKFTFSAWVYLCNPTSGNTPIFGASNTSANQQRIFTNTDGTLQFDLYLSNSYVGRLITTQVLKDIGWYHIVAVYDSGNATTGNRQILYLNGVRITDLATQENVSVNQDGLICGTNLHQIGMHDGLGTSMDGYMAEAVLLDGTVADPSSFGQYDSTGTYWTPKSSDEIKALTFGTNGFYLDNTTNAQTDASGTGNNFTNTGSVALSTNTPTNINTLMNPLSMFQGMSLANGNNKVTFTAAAYTGNIFTIPIPPTGKWKMEVDMTAITGGLIRMGIIEKTEYSPKNMTTNVPFDHDNFGNPDFNTISTSQGNASAIGKIDGTAYSYASEANGSRVVSNGDRWAFYYDADSGKFWAANDDGSGDTTYFYEDSGGTAGNPATGSNPLATSNTSKSYQFYVTGYSDPTANRNFLFKEEADWILTTPTGYAPLTTANIASATTRTTSDLEEYFETVLYTGTGSEIDLDTTNGFAPDLVWIKDRTSANAHWWTDSVRGATKSIFSNGNGAEQTQAQLVKSFDSDGVTLGTYFQINTSSNEYVSWTFKAGGAPTATNSGGASPTSGSVMVDGSAYAGSLSGTIHVKELSVNTEIGFACGVYDATGSAGTIDTLLGASPDVVIVKALQVDASWMVFHYSNGTGKQLLFNSTNGSGTDAQGFTSTNSDGTFGVGTGAAGNTNQTNGTSPSHVFYAWKKSPYNAIESYIGNGNANGSFVPTIGSTGIPIQPSWIMIKRTDAANSWCIRDIVRDIDNPNEKELDANNSNAEFTNSDLDIDTGGFKLRASDNLFNASGGTYIYLAFGVPLIDVDGRIITGR